MIAFEEEIKKISDEYLEGGIPDIEDIKRMSNIVFLKLLLMNKYIDEKQYIRFTDMTNYEFENMIKRRVKNTIINGYSEEKNKHFHILENEEKVFKILEIFDFENYSAKLYNQKGEELIYFPPENNPSYSKEEKEEVICEKITTFLENVFF